MIKIVIDTKGADKGVETLIRGVALALEKFPDASYLLVGDEEYIKAACEKFAFSMERIEILDAPDEITNYDNPAEAIFTKRNSSMIKSLEALSIREDLFGFLTAGNTGALLVGAMRYLPKETRVRPALAALLPAQSGGFTCVVDTGATVDCTPQMLHHFAHLGREFMMSIRACLKPSVAASSAGCATSWITPTVNFSSLLSLQDTQRATVVSIITTAITRLKILFVFMVFSYLWNIKNLF